MVKYPHRRPRRRAKYQAASIIDPPFATTCLRPAILLLLLGHGSILNSAGVQRRSRFSVRFHSIIGHGIDRALSRVFGR